ncbi:aerotolerance-like exported protein [Brachyspira pilosicoli WesB]|uniref:Aerotolerance-like exported protein n=1 Tax=Brachyspira pilosicoli WesB TaxID=1161918 RepID=K0JIA6_BRAPL|nr:SH3 domain-containing protein [Brachyspira pilosicoli]WIH88473.1 SH3 domain-containing protein [Brachyspira pilosicoli]CCG56627.1 aerotolerance-like exported protein [Brachyspira pilosicoli WesB]
MSIKKIIIMFLVFGCNFLFAQNDLENINNIFKNANDLYNQGSYIEANNLYLNLISSNVVSKDLYYNLASSYYEINSNGYAVLWYERALNISPFDKEIKNNINKITERKDYDSFYIIAFYISLILFVFFSAFLFVLFIKKKNINFLLLISCVILIVFSIYLYKTIKSDYIIIIRNTNIYSGSSIKSDIVSSVYEGEKFRVIKESSNWYYVKGISKGWINKEDLEKI